MLRGVVMCGVVMCGVVVKHREGWTVIGVGYKSVFFTLIGCCSGVVLCVFVVF